MPSYLQDEEEELQPLDAPDEVMPKRPVGRWWESPGLAGPPVDDNAPTPGAIAPPDLPDGVLGRAPSSVPGPIPVAEKARLANQRVADIKGEKPNEPKPKWWQRLAAAGVGAAAGYVNAEGKVRHPIDASGAVDTIMGGGDYRRKLSDWQNKVGGAQAQADAANNEQQGWWKNKSLQNDEDLKQAEAERNRATAKYEQGRNEATITGKRIADAEAQDKLALKGREDDAYLLKQGEQPPAGWDVIQSAANPGRAYAAPPRFGKLPPELVDYAPGHKAGELVPASEIKAARTAAQKDTLAQNKPLADRNLTETQLASIATDPAKKPEERAAAEAALKRLDQSKIASRPNFNVTIPGLNDPQGQASKLTGQEFMDHLAQTAPGTAAQVKRIAEGAATLPPFGSRGVTALLRDAVFRYDPEFSEQRAQIRRAFTTGKAGDNIGSLNTATVHLDQLDEVSRAMANGSFQPGNELWNRARAMFGSSAPTNFETLKAAVAGEMANALKGNATDVEIATMGRNLQAANSPQQLNDAIQENLRILGGKLNTYQERYSQQMPGDKAWSPVLPSARAVFEKHTINPTAGPQVNINHGGGRGNAGGQQANPNPSGYVVGHVYGGLTYLGGDPNSQTSWKK